MHTQHAHAQTIDKDTLAHHDGRLPDNQRRSPDMVGRLRRRIFGISVESATFARRGFYVGDPVVRDHLEQIGRTFLYGYHLALEQTAPVALSNGLGHVPLEERGFAYEGAAMALALLDIVAPWSGRRFERFLAGPAEAHTYMVHVGAGWALARLRAPLEAAVRRLDPLLGWLVIDGYGFHEGYFAWPRYLAAQAPVRPLRGLASHVFDQGFGRSLWFVQGADAARIANTIQSLAPDRHSDLWSGVGLACAYAGGVNEATLVTLRKVAGEFLPDVAQGAAFAAGVRERASNPAIHTDLACRMFMGISAVEAAALTQSTLFNLPDGQPGIAYATWRSRIRAQLK